MHRRAKARPFFFTLLLAIPMLIAVATVAAALEAVALATGVGEEMPGGHLLARDANGLSGAAIAVPAARKVAAAAGEASEQHALTAEEEAAINGALMARHPSVIVLSNPTSRYDCHGFTFEAGRHWIGNDRVEEILAAQGWILRVDGAHQVGDIAIYRRDGRIRHSGIISAAQRGRVTRVQSKWGVAGLYEHDPNDVPEDYGQFEIRHRDTVFAMDLSNPLALHAVKSFVLTRHFDIVF